jgi:hypothetical protein
MVVGMLLGGCIGLASRVTDRVVEGAMQTENRATTEIEAFCRRTEPHDFNRQRACDQDPRWTRCTSQIDGNTVVFSNCN